MSETFGAEDLGSYQRWEIPEFGESVNPATPPPPTAEQVERIEAAAYEEGFARGQKDGLAAGANEVRALSQQLQALLDHLAQPLQQRDEEVESALMRLATRIGQRLALHELAIEPSKLQAIVHEAIAALSAVPRELRVLLNPEDERAVRETLQPPPEVTTWRLVADASLARGDCRIAGETGWVDATIQTRTDSIVRAMLEAPEREAA